MAPAFPARLASVLLAVALVVSVTYWALTFSARRTVTEPVVVLPAGEVDPQARLTDVAPIARLFGAASSAEAGGIRGQPTRSYRTGDLVAPGVVLKEVRKDGVVLSRSGRLQELRLPTKSIPAPAPIQR